jgi:hypothetical protein
VTNSARIVPTAGATHKRKELEEALEILERVARQLRIL